MSPSVKPWCRGGCVDPVPTPGVPVTGGCPPWWETHPRGIPVPEGCPSQGCPFWGYAHPFGMLIPGKSPSQGMSCVLNSHPGGVPAPVGGLSQEDAHSRGMPIPEGCPSWREACPGEVPVPGGQPCQQNTCQTWSCPPPLPQPFSGCGQTPRMDVGLFVRPVAISVPSGPCPGNPGALPGPAFPPEPRGAVSPGREW